MGGGGFFWGAKVEAADGLAGFGAVEGEVRQAFIEVGMMQDDGAFALGDGLTLGVAGFDGVGVSGGGDVEGEVGAGGAGEIIVCGDGHEAVAALQLTDADAVAGAEGGLSWSEVLGGGGRFRGFGEAGGDENDGAAGEDVLALTEDFSGGVFFDHLLRVCARADVNEGGLAGLEGGSGFGFTFVEDGFFLVVWAVDEAVHLDDFGEDIEVERAFFG